MVVSCAQQQQRRWEMCTRCISYRVIFALCCQYKAKSAGLMYLDDNACSLLMHTWCSLLDSDIIIYNKMNKRYIMPGDSEFSSLFFVYIDYLGRFLQEKSYV